MIPLVPLTLLFSLLPNARAAPPDDFPGDEIPYRVIPTDIALPENFLGTWLYKYVKCNQNFGPGAKDKIDNAYFDAWVMSNTAGVASNIDWNSAAALEFLGAPGQNKHQQAQIQAVLANVATMIYSYKNLFQHYIKVRCDDPAKLCQNRPDNNPCQPNPPNPDQKPLSPPLAYAKCILTRWQGNPTVGTAGYYVQRNADNLAYYALAKYVMTKNDNIYPHLPIVTYELASPPYPTIPTSSLAIFITEDSTFYLNTTEGLSAWELYPGEDYPGCSDNANDPQGINSLLAINGFTPASAYPDSYNREQIAIASYINPLGDPASWSRLFTYDTGKLSVLVANVLNGPDYVVDPAWKSVIDQAASQGKTIIGYVRTGYLGVSQQRFTTRLGSHDLADWASQIEQDIDKWYELYGSSLGGIFFDEGWPECGPNNIYADLYTYINNYTKRKHPGAFTVLNPGSPIAQCYENTMDALLTFENSYESYQSSFVPNDWTPKDPRKIWHIIYRVPQDKIATVAALARSRHAGLLEITDDDNPNPYDNLPNDAYMQAVLNAVPGGKPRIDDPAKFAGSYVAGLPSNAAVSSSDYSSVTLTWSSVGNALGYAVYKNGALLPVAGVAPG
ncbi:unnamed protein product [Parascedosporium putredinis]|uniref:Uncharacterized protein n=1 Tax=Parascedosporium putredinis TaxID=1442378 RepID=A0A9P1HAA9_9PEZI|nr:unnamed protein product [Parascedosporium putredinis]CAI8002726.1 unnamed protein product [Parascedosporium putredinis]